MAPRRGYHIKCENLYTISQDAITSILGHLSDALQQKLNDSLKAALELP